MGTPDVYAVYSIGTNVRWVGDPCWIEPGTLGVVVAHIHPRPSSGAVDAVLRVRFNDCLPAHVLPVYMTVSPRDIVPI